MTASVESGPHYGWYGDDFTGATDTLATLSRRGVKSFLFLGVPSARHLGEVGAVRAVGIAGAARAMRPTEMATELAPVGRFFLETGVKVLHYKCCSTFDSGCAVGNLATAIETLRPFCAQGQVMVLGGQPSLRRFCTFGNLFAASGSEIHRLDRHPTMNRHPSTPMIEADLRLHLQAMGAGPVALVSWPELDRGEISVGGQSIVLFDVMTQAHVTTAGDEIRRRSADGSVLVVGASSVAEAVFAGHAITEPTKHFAKTDAGPVFAVVGSLSPLTRVQIEAASSYTHIHALPDRMLAEADYRDRLRRDIAASLRNDRNVLLTTAPLDGVATGTAPGLAEATGRFVDRLLQEIPVRRLIAGGGDTSSLVAQNLGLWGLSYGGQISPGVAISTSRSDDPDRDGMTLMLKGGQMGSEDVFDRFAAGW